MISKQDVIEILGAESLESTSLSGRQPTTSLVNISVISRMYDENDFPVIWIGKSYFSFTRFSMTRIADIVEVKYYGW